MTPRDFDIQLVQDNLLEMLELLRDFCDEDLLDYKDNLIEKIEESLEALEVDERLY